MNRPIAIAIAIALVALLPGVAAAQLYKWVDDKGVTHYSETPPPAGKEGKQVPIKPRAAPAPAPAPAPAKAAATGPVKAVAPPVPREYAKSPPAEAPGAADLRRLAGEWKTAAGQPVRFSLTIQPFFETSVRLGFVRQEGGKTQINSPLSFEFTGGDGQGRFSLEFQPTSPWDVRMAPERVDYRLRGDVLEATVTSSVFAGTYTMRQ